jgi:hypothetical protein
VRGGWGGVGDEHVRERSDCSLKLKVKGENITGARVAYISVK